MKPNLGKAVAHLILSPGPEDRVLSKDEWKRALDLALAEHGAADAPHAAYLHADTDHPHLHCFFSRITPAGEVISDSNSYQKNRSASLKITQELQLTPLPNTPSPRAPGDRQALQNASRSAERSGTPGPEKINVQAVREALGKAKTEEDYVLLNAEIGNEIVYLRRGEGQEIFGYKMRRIGSTEWIKASTLAKDISWPRIKHRFVKSPSATPVLQAPTVEAPAAPAQADAYARAPAPLRQMLREQHQKRQLAPSPKPKAQPATRWDIDLAEVDRATRDLGALSRAMALLGSACLKYALSFLNHIIGWIKMLLEKLFGIGVRETQPTSGPQAVAYEPYTYTIESEAREVPDAEAAAQLVNQVTAALESKDAAMLPDVEGRDAIAAEMLADPGRQPEQNALDSMFAADVAHAATPAPVAPDVPPATPPKTALVQFLEAAKAFSLTSSLVRGALEKDIKYVDRQPAARAARDAAMTEHAELTEARRIWKSDNKVLSTLGADPLKFAARIEAAQKRVVAAEKLVDQAERRHGEFEKLWDRTPVPSVPFALQDRHAAATENFKKAQQLLISQARLNLTVLDTNPMLRQKRETFGALIRRAETQLAAFLVDPRTQPKVVKDVDEMIRNLAAEVNIERARLAPRPDADDGQNADEAGQHGYAVPGQR